MSTKEVKAALKSAREAIKNKEFKEALKHCKAVLKLEKENYNAWVFIGLAASELEQPDQAQTAYKKALELEPEQLLAWQGLANLYEKTDQWDFKAELPDVYQKLVELYARWAPIMRKAFLRTLPRSTKRTLDLTISLLFSWFIWLFKYAIEKADLLQLWQQMIKELSGFVETHQTDNETQQHFRALSGQKQYFCVCRDALQLPQAEAKMKEACKSMLSLYPSKSYPLEVLCLHHLKTGNHSITLFQNLNVTRNLTLRFKMQFFSLQELFVVLSLTSNSLKQTGSTTGWCSLAQAQLKLHRYSDSALSCSQGKCFSVNHLCYPQLVVPCDSIGRCPGENSLSCCSFLQAAAQGPDVGESYFLLGKLYWDMGEESRRDRSKAHTHLLKAAKLDPNLGCVYRHLGHYYRQVVQDASRARGCYKKAFELDASDEESGAALVDLSMEQGDMDTALAVLQAVIDDSTPGSAKWAWMRRGLYHLKVGQQPQAIADLQSALRADPEDWVCWECLGEAYLNRRSFTAALKAFGKAHALQPSSIYSVYQTASIKQTLGKFQEAAAEYRQITAREDYVPALKGLGECLLSLAKGLLEDYRDGSAIDLIQQAIKSHFRAVELRPDLSCLWKLLGDACTTVSAVSPNRARVLMPGPLAGLEPSSQNHLLNQAQTLKVGERCYGRALKLMPEAPSLWYDLGLNYHRQASLPCLWEHFHCVKKAIMMDSGNYSYWNALGVIAMSKGLENFALAQHSFIKSVGVEPNNVTAWTNLGTLYLKKENLELSHEAFKVAQSLEPLYVNCWIGQALIAEAVGSYDTMDLFRHTTELSTHTEGVKGYAFWVCSTLLDKSNRDSELYRYNIVQMNAVSAAQTALSKYTERIQTDPDALIMLGFLNEHLQLKTQALQAYQRAVELLQSGPPTDELAFALGSLGRALCSSGQWEEAVRVYSSTPLQELQDLAGLALAHCRAGHIPESINAYERALAIASSEKEKAYILTALALLQHRLGGLDSAKTLLFKCSMLKEPIPESLLCLCALGLDHGDATLAAAALTELLKQGTATGGAVEQRCLLTCALLALQGNYSGVQREASRAVHSNPGNPSLWALLSRLVPQYCPKKANGGAVAGHVACLASMTQGKRALLYSGVNQLAGGRHSGEDRHRNALKTMQRAVLLCPGPFGSLLLRPLLGLLGVCCQPLLMASPPAVCVLCFPVRCVEEIERPLAQALEAWVLQQALAGLTLGGRLDEAEALCAQVLSVSPEHPAIVLSLRRVQCQRLLLAGAGTVLPDAVLEQLSSSVMVNPTNLGAWHWLAELYRSQGLLIQAVMAYRQSLQLASQLCLPSAQIASLLGLALLALGPCMVSVHWNELVLEATSEALKLASSSMALLLQALLQFATKMGARETRRQLERLAYPPCPGEQAGSVVQVARWYLLKHLHAKNDQELMDTLLEHAKGSGDQRLLTLYSHLTSSSS
uniref:SKI3 subunit of superkiller complex n=1 Tax=Gadus morhua TaxID=8049 RepID=A0A8C5C3I7_GADMO